MKLTKQEMDIIKEETIRNHDTEVLWKYKKQFEEYLPHIKFRDCKTDEELNPNYVKANSYKRSWLYACWKAFFQKKERFSFVLSFDNYRKVYCDCDDYRNWVISH